MLYPFAIDAVLVAGGIGRNFDVVWQMLLIGVQSILVTKLVTGITKHLAGRARPDYGGCIQGNELACNDSSESFLSGHTSSAFVGAGLICANQQAFRLYGSATAGIVACSSALVLAGTTGALRMVADRHYLTDVLAGAALGLAAGYLLPNLTNYAFQTSRARAGGTLVPLITPHSLGASYVAPF